MAKTCLSNAKRKNNLNCLVITTSYNQKLLIRHRERNIIYATNMSINLNIRKKKINICGWKATSNIILQIIYAVKLPPAAAELHYHHGTNIIGQYALNTPPLFKRRITEIDQLLGILPTAVIPLFLYLPNTEPSGLQVTRLTETTGSLTRAVCI